MYDHKESLKSGVKHILHRCHMLNLLRKWRGLEVDHMRSAEMTTVFSKIYERGVWIARNGQDPLSGPGSGLEATGELAVQLSAFLKEVKCKRLIDIGCGDFSWMQRVKGEFDYLGLDVVPDVIDANNRLYSNGRRSFSCLDATRSILPCGDVAICREVLFHLSSKDGQRLLRNIKVAGFHYVLLTSDSDVWFNADINNGDYRPVNLAKAPFRLPRPERVLRDDAVTTNRMRGRVLGVWRGANLLS